jgi:predicted nucleic acid-binding protein
VRIVFDTASLITALRSSTGAAAEVARLILRGDIVTLMDQKLGLEYRDVALRPEHVARSGLSPDEILDFIESLERVAEPVNISHRTRPLSSDPNDDMVLDVAIKWDGGCDCDK